MKRKSRIMLAVVAYVMVLKIFEKHITYFFEKLKKFFVRSKENAESKCVRLPLLVIILKPQQLVGIGLRCGYRFQFLLI
ncbi:MAG: hypothetical protein LBT56_03215 [Prevotellaceae bacterium]|jgi:hypothetical protein|nr:hypothetical protein [Prevotellaceae bacterium]